MTRSCGPQSGGTARATPEQRHGGRRSVGARREQVGRELRESESGRKRGERTDGGREETRRVGRKGTGQGAGAGKAGQGLPVLTEPRGSGRLHRGSAPSCASSCGGTARPAPARPARPRQPRWALARAAGGGTAHRTLRTPQPSLPRSSCPSPPRTVSRSPEVS